MKASRVNQGDDSARGLYITLLGDLGNCGGMSLVRPYLADTEVHISAEFALQSMQAAGCKP